MIERIRSISVEAALFGVLVLAGFVIRAGGLAGPLSPDESARALGAWQLHRGSPVDWWDAPAFAVAQAAVFFLFHDSDAAARLIPLLAGAGVIAALWLYRPWLGSLPVIIAAGLLAISPAAIETASRANETSLAALLTMLLGWALLRYWNENKPSLMLWGGIGFGTLLNLGYPGVSGALVLAMFCAAYASFRSMHSLPLPSWFADYRPFGVATLVTCILLSTGLFLFTPGLGVPSIAAWTQHFEPSHFPTPWFLPWLLLATSALPGLFVGLPGAFIALSNWFRRPMDVAGPASAFFAIWGLSGAAFLLLSGDIPLASAVFWAGMPLTVCGALLLGNGLQAVRSDFLQATWPNFATAGVLLTFALLTLLHNVQQPATGSFTSDAIAVLAVVAAALLLSPQATTYYKPYALSAAGGLVVIVLASIHLHGIPWPGTATTTPLAASYVTQVTAFSPYTVEGRRQSIGVQPLLKPDLAWQLRSIPGVSYIDQPSPQLTMIIAEESAGRLVSKEYQGPTLGVTETPSFQTWSAGEVLQWLLFSALPVDTATSDRMSVLKRTSGNR